MSFQPKAILPSIPPYTLGIATRHVARKVTPKKRKKGPNSSGQHKLRILETMCIIWPKECQHISYT